jgi:hypothetical protein
VNYQCCAETQQEGANTNRIYILKWGETDLNEKKQKRKREGWFTRQESKR